MKKYKYNLGILLMTLLLFPIIIFLSARSFKKLRDFCYSYVRDGSIENVEFNSIDIYYEDIKNKNLPKSKILNSDLKELEIIDEKGKISCLVLTKKESKKWVIGLHGWTENKYLALRLTEHYFNNGYNVFLFDSFAHGKTYGDITDIGISTLVIIDKIIDYMKENYEIDSIGMIGNSMGASTSILYTQRGKYKNLINWVVADCGFEHMIRQYRHYISANLLKKKWWLISLFMGHKFNKVTKTKQTKYDLLKGMKNCSTPTLFIHSIGDTFIPYEMSENMYKYKLRYNPNSNSLLWIPKDSLKTEHVRTIADFNDEYIIKTLNFAKTNE
ncbi:hypothetical protein SHELI_v1c01550 [Spiroplasma helicoides]|uniref:AB hydrolase-1 domain-containing protein n=1 Tax=Spiroplasma helicoides TaxID=216938 RepID=A0A1B3SJL4_9MOLU|nr:alpha/beta fold hydrolase [Spiroplasma helicoides]AOG60110.1 hypothetical protein SHELI_v1c01550 [Spiroplasma helicoides]